MVILFGVGATFLVAIRDVLASLIVFGIIISGLVIVFVSCLQNVGVMTIFWNKLGIVFILGRGGTLLTVQLIRCTVLRCALPVSARMRK